MINASLLIYEGTTALKDGTYTLIETTDAIESVMQFTKAPELFLVIEFKNDYAKFMIEYRKKSNVIS